MDLIRRARALFAQPGAAPAAATALYEVLNDVDQEGADVLSGADDVAAEKQQFPVGAVDARGGAVLAWDSKESRLVARGENKHGALGLDGRDVTAWTRVPLPGPRVVVVQIAVGSHHALLRTADGAVLAKTGKHVAKQTLNVQTRLMDELLHHL